jgi:hypothetical protein
MHRFASGRESFPFRYFLFHQRQQMATAVNITLTLNESGVVQGLNSVKSQMASLGPTAATAGKQVESAFNGIESSERQAHIAGMLITRTLGVEIPRALETVMARSAILGPLMQAAFPLAVFASAASSLGMVAGKIEEAANSASIYLEQVKQVEEQNAKASQQAFINPKTIEFTRQHLDQVNQEVVAANKLANTEITRGQAVALAGTMEEKLVTALGFGVINQQQQVNLIDKATVKTAEQAALAAHLNELYKQGVTALQEQADLAGKKGFAKIGEERKQALKKFHDISGAADSPQKTQGEAAIKAIYDQQDIELSRQNALELMKIQDQVAENALTGEAKVRQEETDHINESRAQMADRLGISQKAVEQNAIFQEQVVRYHQEASDKIKQIERQKANDIEALQQQVEDATLTGDDKIYADQQKMVSKYRAIYEAAPNPQNWETYQAAIVAADQIAQAKLRASHDQTTQADAARLAQLTALQERASEDQITAQQHAALALVPEWKQATAQIQIELDNRLRSIQNEETKALAMRQKGDAESLAIEQDAQAKRYDAWVTADQKIRQEQQKMADQLGSQMETVFNDIGSGKIGQTILNDLKKLFFQILAQWVLTMQQMGGVFQQVFGFLTGNTSAITGPGGLFNGLFGGSSSSSSSVFPGGIPGLQGGVPLVNGQIPPGAAVPGAPGGSSLFGGLLGSGISAGPSLFGASGSSSSTAAGVGALGGSSAAGVLSTQSLSNALGTTAISTGSQALAAPKLGAGLGSLFSMNTLTSLLPMAAMLGGGMLGGGIGQVGGMVTALSLMAALNPTGAAAGLLGHLGLGSAFGLGALGAVSGGLLGFGVGQNFGMAAGAGVGVGTALGLGLLFGLGPVGLAIGALVGLLGGVFGGLFGGSKRRKEANNYFSQQIDPAVKKIVSDYDSFQLDYASASGQLTQLETQAKDQLGKLKGEGSDVFKNKVEPDITAALAQIGNDEKERTRRAGLVFGPPQFHDGGYVQASTMSAYTTKPNELLALIKHGEFVVNPTATAKNLNTLQAINAGGQVSQGGPVQIIIKALDSQDVDAWLRKGGARMISGGLNRYWNKEGGSW